MNCFRLATTQLTKLKKLDLSGNLLESSDLDVLSKGLPLRTPRLEELLVLDNPFCKNDPHYMARLLPITNLKLLDHAVLREGIRELITAKRNKQG